jgi:hypothetical protein
MILWIEVGGSMIAIDTLVHNFLHRTGILHRFNANHLYRRISAPPSLCSFQNRRSAPWQRGQSRHSRSSRRCPNIGIALMHGKTGNSRLPFG